MEHLIPFYFAQEFCSLLIFFQSSMLALMAVCIVKQIVIADALLEIDKVRKICIEKSTADNNWQNLLVFASKYIHEIVSVQFRDLDSFVII